MERLRTLAIHGYLGAQCKLGAMYWHGDGVTQNERSAILWYEKAARQGNAVAQRNLAEVYRTLANMRFSTREEFYKKAVEWYLEAASQGEERAKLRLRELRRGKKG